MIKLFQPVLLIAILLTMLAGCGDTTTPNTLRIIDHNFSVKIWQTKDAHLVQTLYAHILTLPKRAPAGQCPKHYPDDYAELLFSHDQDHTQYIRVDTCNGLILSSDDVRQPDPQFFALINQVEQQPPISCTPDPYNGDGC